MRWGFHPGFVLQVLADGELLSVGLEDWLARLELDGEPNPEPVEASLLVAAIAQWRGRALEKRRGPSL